MTDRTRVAVIGSNSFSGSDFVDLLLEEGRFSVLGISRSAEKGTLYLPYLRHGGGFLFRQADLNRGMGAVMEALDAFRPEYIVNFAALSEVAPSWEHPIQWFRTNTLAVTELVHHLKDREYLKRFLHISTPEVYGTCSGAVREDTSLNPSTPYAASKAAGDLSIFTYVKNFAFPMVMVRATNVYGAHQQLFKIVPRTVIAARLKTTVELHGGGRAVKSYIHIRDVSRGELAVLEKGEEAAIYHLSPDGGGIAVRDLVELICRRCGVDFGAMTKVVGERLGQDAAYVIDSTRAREELGWSPRVGLEEGIDGVVDWVDRFWTEIGKEPLEYVHRP